MIKQNTNSSRGTQQVATMTCNTQLWSSACRHRFKLTSPTQWGWRNDRLKVQQLIPASQFTSIHECLTQRGVIYYEYIIIYHENFCECQLWFTRFANCTHLGKLSEYLHKTRYLREAWVPGRARFKHCNTSTKHIAMRIPLQENAADIVVREEQAENPQLWGGVTTRS